MYYSTMMIGGKYLNALIRVIEEIGQRCGPDDVFYQLLDNLLSEGIYSSEELLTRLEDIEDEEIRAALEEVEYV